MKHLISARQFRSRDDVLALLGQATAYKLALDARPHPLGVHGVYAHTQQCGRLMATLFYEPSLRTRFSFEAAMLRLGGQVVSSEAAAQFSSAVKGESLPDTIRVVSGLADIIVLRHPQDDAAAVATEYATVPVINAGSGSGEHPSQALLDLFTIHERLGRLDGLRVAMVGDLRHGRTVHSLLYLLGYFERIEIMLVSPVELRLPAKCLGDSALSPGCPVVHETHVFRDLLAWRPDVLYMTRVQDERSQLVSHTPYNLTAVELAELPAGCVVMHPLPRRDEIDPAVDGDSRAVYFEQAHNGLYVRMAILRALLP